jgi:hypothetical protein
MHIRPRTPDEKEILAIWRDIHPHKAFFAGVHGQVGRVLVPTPENIENLMRRIALASARSQSESRRKLLACFGAYLLTLEPVHCPDNVLDAFFGHLAKEGINTRHLTNLAECSRLALNACLETSRRMSWPVGQRLLVLIRCNGLLELLGAIKNSARHSVMREQLTALMNSVSDFGKYFRVQNFCHGTFDEVWSIIRKHGCELGRVNAYSRVLHDIFDYPESPSEVESKGLAFLRHEFSEYVQLTNELAADLHCEARPDALIRALKSKRSIAPQKRIPYLNRLRKTTVKIIQRRFVRIAAPYCTKVIETPEYLTGITPSGASFFLDYLTNKPQQLFLNTIDLKRDPYTAPAQLLNLLMHEEYGHCVHVSNSALNLAAKPEFAERLWSIPGIAVSEGISFHRESEFMEYLDDLVENRHPTKDEEAFIKVCESQEAFDGFAKEYGFYTKTWRIIRFLRAIGDVRINSGKQELPDFIEWARKETSLPESLIYLQLFPAHQSSMGGATAYAILGDEVRRAQTAARDSGINIVNFNSYASSLGFVSRTGFVSRLSNYAET